MKINLIINKYPLCYLMILFLLFSIGSMAQTEAQLEEEKEAKADEVIQKYINALGGENQLNKIHSLTIKGQGKGGNYDMMLPMTVYVKNPSKNKVEISIMNQKIVMATDGHISWGLNPFLGNGQPQQIPNLNEEVANHVFFTIGRNLIDYRKKGYRAEYMGKTNFQGRKAHRIKLISDLAEDDYYIDTENYYLLMAKVDYNKNYFDNYKKVGNIFFPHSIEGGKQNFKMEVDQVIINDSIADDEFKMPFTQFNTQEHILLNQNIEEETFEFSDEDFNPQDLVRLYAETVGQETDLLSSKSMHISGQMTVGSVDIPFEMYSKQPNKFRMEMKMMDQTAISATNGHRSWEVSPFEGVSQAMVIDDSELTSDREMFSFGRELIRYNQLNIPLSYLGKTKVKGRETHVLKMTRFEEEEILYFLDAENYQLLLKHNKMTGNQEFFEEYRQIQDILIPYSLERYDHLANSNIKIKLEKFDFDDKLSNKLFEFPRN